MDNHKKHLYIHKKYGASISFSGNDNLLPKDKRLKPYPSIRKYKLKNVKTWEDYFFKFIKYKQIICKKHMIDHANRVFNGQYTNNHRS